MIFLNNQAILLKKAYETGVFFPSNIIWFGVWGFFPFQKLKIHGFIVVFKQFPKGLARSIYVVRA
jgi:hypothetical protein